MKLIVLEYKYNVILKNINISNNEWDRVSWIYNLDEIVKKNDEIIEIKLSDFREKIKSLFFKVKKNNIQIEYADTISKNIISNIISDIKYCESNVKTNKFSSDQIEKLLDSSDFNRKLEWSQLRDIHKLLNLKHGANFSVPGAGKTTTLLAIHSVLRLNNYVEKLLVVSPRNAFISWEQEIGFCLNKEKAIRLTGGKDNIHQILKEDLSNIYLISYGQLPQSINDIIDYLILNNCHLVIDESHRIKKGLQGIYGRNVLEIADFAKRKDIMTGTPLPNSITDLESQLSFLWPSVNFFNNKLKGLPIVDIHNKIKPYYSRTTKKEIGLDPPNIKIIDVKMDTSHSALYSILKSEIKRIYYDMPSQEKDFIRNFAKPIIRLIQCASNPYLILENDDFRDIDSNLLYSLYYDISKHDIPNKFKYVNNWIYNLTKENKKGVIWTSFVDNIIQLETILEAYSPVSIYGDIKTGTDESDIATREGRIFEFHENDECRVLIGNPAACGEGISLHKAAQNAIYLDRTFNAAHFIQSMDRIHRLGMPPGSFSNIEILRSQNTIDEIVDIRLNEKIHTMMSILNDDHLSIINFDEDDCNNIEMITKLDIERVIDHLLN